MDYIEEDLKEFVLEEFLSGIACSDPSCNKIGAFFISNRVLDKEKPLPELMSTVVCQEHIVLFLQDGMIPILKELNKRYGIINKPIAEAKE